ncbi:hypothetical protein OGAPHI_007053 [Ogataea philodendri]|uniref:Phosphoribulokinase/uridine kinase domain-containing protein n=1 Tax=Ogataea philodendri TaxID=1378263 RepID=A0A9P8NVM4_9ASCO|nr:uncharacterized protein OGAPHI_007053 [Ogataea philodendri]KAH3660467.1 hypothetical protein OGAPHI_007053 [Ogataea philodendri]
MEDYQKPNYSEFGPSRFDFFQVRAQMEARELQGCDVIIVHGLYALYDKALLESGTIKIFIDCDADVRLGRWIKRDILAGSATGDTKAERGALLKRMLTQYLSQYRVEMDEFIFRTKEFADIILPRGAELAGLSLIIDGIQHLIKDENDNTIMTIGGWGHDNNLQIRKNTNTVLSNQSQPTFTSLKNDNFENHNRRFFELN